MAKYEFDGDKFLKASNHQKEWGEKLIEEINNLYKSPPNYYITARKKRSTTSN